MGEEIQRDWLDESDAAIDAAAQAARNDKIEDIAESALLGVLAVGVVVGAVFAGRKAVQALGRRYG